MYQPHFSYTHDIVKTLMRIEHYCTSMVYLKLPSLERQKMLHTAKVKRTHYSTSIEGNTLSYDQVERAIQKKAGECSLNAEREVVNYWDAMNYLDAQHKRHTHISEDFIKTLHGYITKTGRRVIASSYREATPPGVLFAVYDSVTRTPAYIPPEYIDVGSLMSDLVSWYAMDNKTPEPIKAAIFLYQFVTIHPFRDGNGRTARALATYILMETGYDMKGCLSMEENYASDLQGYYDNLQMGLPALYYNGRINPPHLEQWIGYFLNIMALNSEKIYLAAQSVSIQDKPKDQIVILNIQELKIVRYMLETQKSEVTPKELAVLFHVSTKTISRWCKNWCERGILIPNIKNIRTTSYSLSPDYASISLSDMGIVDI